MGEAKGEHAAVSYEALRRRQAALYFKNKRVPRKEFDRIMRAIKDQTRKYPQEALEDIFLYLDLDRKEVRPRG